MSLVIREMELSDVPELARMEAQIFSVPWSEQAFARTLDFDYVRFLIALADEKIVGCVGATFLGDEGDIDKVMVAENCRGQGIATALVSKMLKLGEETGITAFTLEVRKGNASAIHLYEKMGFIIEGTRPNFYDKPKEDALIMWRR